MDKEFKLAKRWIQQGYPMPVITSKRELREAKQLFSEVSDYNYQNPGTVDPQKFDELVVTLNEADDRHWTFQWLIIVGAIVSVFLLNWWGGSKKDDIAKQQLVVESVEKWQPGDTTFQIADFKTNSDRIDYSTRLSRPALYKAYELQSAAKKYYGVQSTIDYYTERVNTLTEKEKVEEAKKQLEERIKNKDKNEKEALDKFNQINSLKFEGIKEMALKEVNGQLEGHQNTAGRLKFWFWFLIICIPLYIFACRPHGYTLQKFSMEASTLNFIQKFGLWASGALVAGSAALQFTTIITKWSDGSTTKSDDGMGPAIAALKIALLVAALVVFCFTCCFIMAYATISGLIRNYDWTEILGKLKKN